MNREINYISLFSGTGGFEKGFLDAGFIFKNLYFSEVDKYASANYKHNFPYAKSIGDIRQANPKNIKEKLNLLTFGFPCQDVSVAGNGQGLAGERSSLFFEALRFIKELRPTVFIFENVKGLFSSNKGRDFEKILRTIADLGIYECEWQLCNTSWFLPQNRERVYFIGHLRGESRPKVFPFRETDFNPSQRISEFQSGMTIVGHIGENNSEANRVYATSGLSRTIKNGGGQGSKTGLYSINRYGCFSDTNIQCLDATYHKGPESNYGSRSYVVGYSRSKNGKEIKRHLKSVANTIKGMADNTKQYILQKLAIRRLTPLECERLQGFPDDWTALGDFENKIKHISDTQRYKMLGNAVTTSVVKAIAERLLEKE